MDLKQLERECLRRGVPIIGEEESQILEFFVELLRPKKVLELGTANGYSGIILGSEGAKLTTLEIDKKIAAEAKENFTKFNIDAKIIVGDALQTIKEVRGKFDIIFLDFTKRNYNKILPVLFEKLNNKGILIADDVLFDKCKDFKESVLSHPKLKTMFIRVGHGLSVSIKK
ncbi:class I SAM-dependent methyltransferase [archaeon]|nr:class I SAM-dependent methyltransferase [archaeon]